MKPILYVIPIIITVGIVAFFMVNQHLANQQLVSETTPSPSPSSSPQSETNSSDYTAQFIIFTNGTRRNFSASMYHNLDKDVFITATKPEIIYVKNSNITWGDFFNTLPMKLTESCLTTGTKQVFCTNDTSSLKFFLNGQKVENLLQRVIQPEDKLVVSYGPLNDAAVEDQLKATP